MPFGYICISTCACAYAQHAHVHMLNRQWPDPDCLGPGRNTQLWSCHSSYWHDWGCAPPASNISYFSWHCWM